MSLPLGYVPGDTVRVFESRGNGFYTGTVQKVSPSGQITVAFQRANADGMALQRFTPSGRAVGSAVGGYYRGPYIMRKSEQEERAAAIRVSNRAARRRIEYRNRLDALRTRDLSEVEEVLGLLRELMDFVAEDAA